jgi:hypothetical protein
VWSAQVIRSKDLNMLADIVALLKFFRSLWEVIPPKTREAIIQMLADAYDEFFRDYYRSHSNKGNGQ